MQERSNWVALPRNVWLFVRELVSSSVVVGGTKTSADISVESAPPWISSKRLPKQLHKINLFILSNHQVMALSGCVHSRNQGARKARENWAKIESARVVSHHLQHIIISSSFSKRYCPHPNPLFSPSSHPPPIWRFGSTIKSRHCLSFLFFFPLFSFSFPFFSCLSCAAAKSCGSTVCCTHLSWRRVVTNLQTKKMACIQRVTRSITFRASSLPIHITSPWLKL